jgi:hypothetical protein
VPGDLNPGCLATTPFSATPVLGAACARNAVLAGSSSLTSVPASYTSVPGTVIVPPTKFPSASNTRNARGSSLPAKASLLGMTIEAKLAKRVEAASESSVNRRATEAPGAMGPMASSTPWTLPALADANADASRPVAPSSARLSNPGEAAAPIWKRL